ncbi:hypothetical protein [Aeromicrobium sp. UC242_57]|uniref:arsenate reductase/protein-tyrosine-phosphatase family protein n=1 Tax=Aeromicrobium sp. UC242_57 TaxID=3374624 RepID=UPI0037AC43BE
MVDRRFAILAVCTANICRSPLMEILLKAQLDSSRFEVASAGVRGWDRRPMDSMAAMEAMRLGHEADSFRSHPIDSYLVDSADLILTATRAHRSDVLSMTPQALRRQLHPRRVRGPDRARRRCRSHRARRPGCPAP